MSLLPVKIPAGFFRNGTEYEAAGRWYDGNLVRWQNDRIRPFGGWEKLSSTQAALNGMARAAITWRANNGFRYGAIGTNTKIYINSGGNFVDLTPTTPVALVAGRQDAVAGPGYGAAAYGRGSYGTRRLTTGITLDAATWSFDTWGEDLLAVLSSDGNLWEYAPGGASLATVANAPTGNIGVLVTDEDYVVLLGAGGNLRQVKWCDQGNNTVWTPLDTNTAGGLPLNTQGNIVTGRRVGTVPVIWTTQDVHALNYIGAPLVYGINRIGENCGVISANAVATNESGAEWMGLNGFFSYDGIVRPLPCEVQDYVFPGNSSPPAASTINMAQRSKIFVGRNSKDGELIWFYPSRDSVEIDSYVVHNYFKSIWYFGKLPRTCWIDRGVFSNPIAVDTSGNVFAQESGTLADGSPRAGVFVQSGPVQIGDGDRVLYSTLMVPDAEAADAITLSITAKTAPNGKSMTVGPYGMTANAEGYVGVRVAGKQAALRYDQVADKNWSIGVVRFETGLGGRR